LIEDTKHLESEYDKILQLSRIELGDNLNLTNVNLIDFIENFIKKESIKIEIKTNGLIPLIWGDEYALKIIFKNLFENSKKYSTAQQIVISIEQSNNKVSVKYNDSGKKFAGEVKKLGTLFYKHNTNKGSGIGLYLIRKLMTKMSGNLKIENNENLIFYLEFKCQTRQS